MEAFTHPFRVDHLSIHVRDLDVSCEFYGRVLGLREIPAKASRPQIRWFDFGDGRELHVIAGSETMSGSHKNTHLALATAQFDALVTHLRAHAVPFGEPRQRVDGFRQLYFTDPDGHWIEINDVA